MRLVFEILAYVIICAAAVLVLLWVTGQDNSGGRSHERK